MKSGGWQRRAGQIRRGPGAHRGAGGRERVRGLLVRRLSAVEEARRKVLNRRSRAVSDRTFSTEVGVAMRDGLHRQHLVQLSSLRSKRWTRQGR